MALQTSGFALSALPRTPTIPDNVGKMDVPGLYDAVVKGLQTHEALRTTLARQQVADAQLHAAQVQAQSQALASPAQAQADVATANRTTALASPALVGQEATNRGVALDADLLHEQQQRDDLRFRSGLGAAGRVVLDKFGPEVVTTGSTLKQPDGTVKSTSTKSAVVDGQTLPLATSSTESPFALVPGVPGEIRTFEQLTAGMSPADREKARRIHLGIEGRASSAGMQVKEVPQEDGSTQLMVFNPRTGAFDLPYVSPAPGAQAPSNSAPLASSTAAEPSASPLATPASPTSTPAAALASPAASPASGVGFRGQSTLDKERAKKEVELEGQRQSLQPKAKANLETLRSKTDLVNQTIDEAKALTNGYTAGYGSLFDRLPSSDARALKAKVDTIRANLGFDALTEMRLNSPTGGALGNVSDYEGKNLQSTMASLDTGVAPEEFLKALDRVKEARAASLSRLEKAYDNEFTPQRMGKAAISGGLTVDDLVKKYTQPKK